MLSSSKQISTERPLTDSEITKPAARKMKTTTCPQTNRCSPPVGFFGNKAEKLYIFAKKAERGGKRGDGLFDPTASSGFSLRPPEEWTDYHRLSGRKRSCRISTRPGEVRSLDADKAFPFFFIKRLVEKTNPKKLQCGEDRAVRPNAAKWLNYQNG